MDNCVDKSGTTSKGNVNAYLWGSRQKNTRRVDAGVCKKWALPWEIPFKTRALAVVPRADLCECRQSWGRQVRPGGCMGSYVAGTLQDDGRGRPGGSVTPPEEPWAPLGEGVAARVPRHPVSIKHPTPASRASSGGTSGA